MKAVIALADTESGEIDMNVVFEGGFSPESHAHQHVNILLKIFDFMLERKAKGDVEIVNIDNLDAGIKSAFDLLEKQQFGPNDEAPNAGLIVPNREMTR